MDIALSKEDRAVGKAGEIGPGAWLGVTLAPAGRTTHDVRNEPLSLLFRAVFQQHGAEHGQAHAA